MPYCWPACGDGNGEGADCALTSTVVPVVTASDGSAVCPFPAGGVVFNDATLYTLASLAAAWQATQPAGQVFAVPEPDGCRIRVWHPTSYTPPAGVPVTVPAVVTTTTTISLVNSAAGGDPFPCPAEFPLILDQNSTEYPTLAALVAAWVPPVGMTATVNSDGCRVDIRHTVGSTAPANIAASAPAPEACSITQWRSATTTNTGTGPLTANVPTSDPAGFAAAATSYTTPLSGMFAGYLRMSSSAGAARLTVTFDLASTGGGSLQIAARTGTGNTLLPVVGSPSGGTVAGNVVTFTAPGPKSVTFDVSTASTLADVSVAFSPLRPSAQIRNVDSECAGNPSATTWQISTVAWFSPNGQPNPETRTVQFQDDGTLFDPAGYWNGTWETLPYGWLGLTLTSGEYLRAYLESPTRFTIWDPAVGSFVGTR